MTKQLPSQETSTPTARHNLLLAAGILIAALLWFLIFSPWTASHFPFWLSMTVSAIILSPYATLACREWLHDIRFSWGEVLLGMALATAFWGVFFMGEKVSRWMFAFARGQVDTIYSLGDGVNATAIALLLLLVIGPAEEIFWRGFVEHRLIQRIGAWGGWIVATLAYALVHVWSFNFMLVMAALVIGALWGFAYMKWPHHLAAIIVSHALWDIAAFVIFPF